MFRKEQIESSETSAIINQTPGNHPKEDILYSKHGESLKSRIKCVFLFLDPQNEIGPSPFEGILSVLMSPG
jgi:hypothetical protein